MTSQQKIFILDTNVILHDSTCIYNFQEHDIIIPITVLEELDNFKKGSQIINYHARKFIRSLDELSSEKLFNGGMKIGPDNGRITVKLERKMHDDLVSSFPNADKSDHKILNIAYCQAKENDQKAVILVSKDMNLRMKARSIGLWAEDYTTDHVRDPQKLYTGCRYADAPEMLIDQIYNRDEHAVDAAGIETDWPFEPNEFAILKNGKKSALATFKKESNSLELVQKQSAYGIVPRNAEQSFAAHALLDSNLPLVTVTGKAGTGKTLLALAAALESRSKYRQILLTRPVVPLSNKDIGYLPGDIQSKIKPYMQPLYDNLGVIRNQFSENSEMYQRLQRMIDDEKLIIEPLAYIRGRSLVRMYMIVDEAQNLTPHEVKTIVSRAGDGSKVVLTGDPYQIDSPYLDAESNGLTYLVEAFKGQNLAGHISLAKSERSPLAELAAELL